MGPNYILAFGTKQKQITFCSWSARPNQMRPNKMLPFDTEPSKIEAKTDYEKYENEYKYVSLSVLMYSSWIYVPVAYISFQSSTLVLRVVGSEEL